MESNEKQTPCKNEVGDLLEAWNAWAKTENWDDPKRDSFLRKLYILSESQGLIAPYASRRPPVEILLPIAIIKQIIESPEVPKEKVLSELTEQIEVRIHQLELLVKWQRQIGAGS